MGIHGITDLSESTDQHINAHCVAIMGGTFDPIHNGHLRAAVEILDQYGFSELRLVPCFQPVHKNKPTIHPQDRLAMVQMACQSDERLKVDDREINRMVPSYTIDTLKELRTEFGQTVPLIMVLGMDSFLSLPAWKEWRSITDYAHIFVVSRPSWEPDFVSELADFYENSRADDIAELQSMPFGKVHLETLTPLSISSSMIRSLCRKKQSIAYLLPEKVQRFIEKNKLYL